MCRVYAKTVVFEYQRSTGEKQDFLDRIIPLTLNDAQFGNWRERVEIARHWQNEFHANEGERRASGRRGSGPVQSNAGLAQQVGDIMAHVNDVLRPVGFDSIVRDDFAALKQMLAQRVSGPAN